MGSIRGSSFQFKKDFLINFLNTTFTWAFARYGHTIYSRKLVVDDWLANALLYQSFMVDSVQVEQEAARFIESGYFYGDLADISDA